MSQAFAAVCFYRKLPGHALQSHVWHNDDSIASCCKLFSSQKYMPTAPCKATCGWRSCPLATRRFRKTGCCSVFRLFRPKRLFAPRGRWGSLWILILKIRSADICECVFVRRVSLDRLWSYVVSGESPDLVMMAVWNTPSPWKSRKENPWQVPQLRTIVPSRHVFISGLPLWILLEWNTIKETHPFCSTSSLSEALVDGFFSINSTLEVYHGLSTVHVYFVDI